MNKLRYRAYYGFNPKEYIAFTEDELEKVKYAMANDSLYTQGGKTVKGGAILRIEEDFRFYTGWYDTYTPKEADDLAQIGRDMPPLALFEARQSLASQRVNYIMKTGKTALLDSPAQIDTLLLTASTTQ